MHPGLRFNDELVVAYFLGPSPCIQYSLAQLK